MAPDLGTYSAPPAATAAVCFGFRVATTTGWLSFGPLGPLVSRIFNRIAQIDGAMTFVVYQQPKHLTWVPIRIGTFTFTKEQWLLISRRIDARGRSF